MFAQLALDKVWEDLLKQSVVGGVSLGMVYGFLRYLHKRDHELAGERASAEKARVEAWNAQLLAFREAFEKMHSEHIYAREQTKLSVDRNTAALETNSSATNRTSHEISSLTKSIDNLARSNGHHK